MTETPTKHRHLVQPLGRYRFRLANVHLDVAKNVSNIAIDFVTKTVKMQIRGSILGLDFERTMNFGTREHFTIDALTPGIEVLFSLRPFGLKCTKHEVLFEYASHEALIHDIEFTFSSMDIQYPTEDEELDNPAPVASDPNFPTIAELAEQMAKGNLTDSKPKSKTVTIMDDPIERDSGC